MPRVNRKDNWLNDAIVDLDQYYLRANSDVSDALEMIAIESPAALAFIEEETAKCLDLRYYLENYHCISDENGNFRALWPWWDHQEILYEAMQEEWSENGYCKIIVLKPRQTGISVWTAASMFHRTIYTPHSFTMLVAQNPIVSTALQRMILNAYNALPWWLRPEYLYKTKGDAIEFQRKDERDRIVNPGLGSAIVVSHAAKQSGVAIGRTIRNLHACLTEKNLIYASNGCMASIAEAGVGSQVLTETGYATVTAFSARQASSIYEGAENGFRITSWNNSAFPVEGTGNHKILCVEMTPIHIAAKRRRRRGEREHKLISEAKMVELKDVTKKHSLVIPVRPITSNGKIPGGVKRGKRAHGGGKQSAWFPPKDAKELGFAVGLYLAEGSCNRRITITLDQDEQQYADRFAKAIAVPYGKVVRRIESRTCQYHFYGAALAEWFSKNVGEKDDKRIPDWMWALGEDALAACVEGLILGDGHISPQNRTTSFTSTRAQLAVAIRDAVLSLGMGYGGITSREAGLHYGRNCQKIYAVRWCHEVDEAIRMRFGWDIVPSSCHKDYAHWQYSKDKKIAYVNIRSVERVQLGIVYDIEVGTADHTYLLPGAVTHNSEVSRWPSGEVFHGDIAPTMNAKDTYAVMESTGLGRNGLFYEWWQGSMDGDTGWRPLFIPVYKVKKYYLPIRGKHVIGWALTQEEAAFTARIAKEEKFDIPAEFWNFRRQGIRAAKRGDGKAGFLESYPITPAEAFQGSGICAFDSESLEEQQLRFVCKPLWAGEIFLSDDERDYSLSAIRPVEDDEVLPKRKGARPSERLHIWVQPEPGQTYYVSGDVALGVKDGDYSVASVWCAGPGTQPDELVANWWGHTPPQNFAKILVALGKWYNDAEIAVEYQQSGITTGDKLVEMDYPALYRERMKDRPGGAFKPYFHFVTNVKTRESIIATMNEALLSHNQAGDPGVIIHCEELLDEMIDFASIGGRMEGQGNNDDGCMSSMIGLYCMRETTTHIKASPDSTRVRESGDINVYGVFDPFMRQRGQYGSPREANGVIEGKVGWTVRPILVCQANTLYSRVHTPGTAEFELRYKHGMDSTHILPDAVAAYRDAVGFNGRNRRGGSAVDRSDPDW